MIKHGIWLRDIPRVLGFIGGTSDRPAPITEKKQIQFCNELQEGVDKPKPKILFEPGEVVRVMKVHLLISMV